MTLTRTSHGYVAGDSILFTAYTGSLNGITSANGGVVLRVASATTNAFTATILSSSGFSCGATAGRLRPVAQNRTGYGADLITQLGADAPSTLVSTNTYHEVDIVGLASTNGSNAYVKTPAAFSYVVYINAGDGDALDLLTGISYRKQWLDAAGSVADPALLA